MSPRDAADLEWPLIEGMQVSALPPVWIAMIISCWSVKLLKLPSVTLTHVCGTNSHNWWTKGLPGVGVVKIFYDSDSSGWKTFRLLDSNSTALLSTQSKDQIESAWLSYNIKWTWVFLSHSPWCCPLFVFVIQHIVWLTGILPNACYDAFHV